MVCTHVSPSVIDESTSGSVCDLIAQNLTPLSTTFQDFFLKGARFLLLKD